MDAKAIAIGGGIAAVVVLIILYQARRDAIAIGGAVASAAHALNPLNQNNVISGTVNEVGSALTGDSSFSLGVWLYDMTHSTAPA